MLVRKAYKVRLYPTKEQEVQMIGILKGCNFVWNFFLKKRQDYFLENKKTIPYFALARELTVIRKTFPELEGLQTTPLSQSLRRLDVAYNRFFRKIAKFPRFKKDWDTDQSFQKHKDWKIVGNKIQVQKDLVLKIRGVLPPLNVNKIGTLVVRRVASKWYGSIFVQEDIKTPTEYSSPLGLDVGINSLIATSDGLKFNSTKPSYDAHPKMMRLQQKMARQKIGSNRRAETRKQIASLYHKLVNTKRDHLHKTTHAVLKNNPSLIALENLSVMNMMKNHKLARTLADVSLGELLRQLKYKQTWKGGEVFEINRFYPSTKTCSGCGYINQEMSLGIRNWTCPSCGIIHDRDVNAAKVILQQAIGRGTVNAEK